MSFELLKNEKNVASIKVIVDNKSFQEAVEKAYKAQRGRYQIPGFRKGKAPRKIIEMNYGEGVFFEEAVNILLPEYYGKAVDELAIEPVARPDIDIVQIGKDEEMIFTAEVAVKPEFSLGDYKGIEVEDINVEITDEQIEEDLKKDLEKNARMVNVEDRAAEMGDTLTIDYKGFVGDEQFEGGTADGHKLELGSNAFIPGFEEQLVGAELASDVVVNVTFPEAYQAEHLAGKEAKFEVKVHEIRAKELPALDDEFAKDTSEFDTLDELKADIRKRLVEGAENSRKSAIRDRVIEKAMELLEVEIPEAMIESEIETMIRDFEQQLQYQGLNLDQYMQFTNSKIEDLKNQMKPDAANRIKTGMVIEGVQEKENIEVTEEEINEELTKIAEYQQQSVEDVKKIFANDDFAYLKSNIKSRKAVDVLVDNAKLV